MKKNWNEMTNDELLAYAEALKAAPVITKEMTSEALDLCLHLTKELNEILDEIGRVYQALADGTYPPGTTDAAA